MGNDLQNLVWYHSEHTGMDLLVLVKVADNCDDDTHIGWPGIRYLAALTRMTERNVQYILRRLEQSGEISTLIGKSVLKTNLYRINVDTLKGKPRMIPPRGNDPAKAFGFEPRAVPEPTPEGEPPFTGGVNHRSPSRVKQLSPKPLEVEPLEKNHKIGVEQVRPDDVPFSDDGSIDDDIEPVDTAEADAPTESTTAKPKPKTRAKPKRTIPEDWQPTADERRYAIDHGVPEHALNRTVEEFRNYWLSVGGVKANWGMTWRNRILQIESRATARAENIALRLPLLTKTSGETATVRTLDNIGQDRTARTNKS